MVMEKGPHLLIGIDGSSSSTRAVEYVAAMVAGGGERRIVLLHVLPPIPPELLEFGGAEDPEEERKLDEALKQEQEKWIKQATQAAAPLMENAKAILQRAGFPAAQVSPICVEAIHRPDIVRELIETAEKERCGTIVVGKEAYPAFQDMVHQHVGEELVKKASGFVIWVVE